MNAWSVVSVRSVPRRVEQVIAVTDSVTCGNAVNLGTRTAPAERANVRGIRGLTTTTFQEAVAHMSIPKISGQQAHEPLAEYDEARP